MRISHCHNIQDFCKLAKKRLPSPLFNYIDGGADDEMTLRRNSKAFDGCDLVPRALSNVESIDLSTNILGQKVKSPLFLSPTGMNRLFHHDGERAVAKAAEMFGQYYSLSTLSSISIEEVGLLTDSPKMFQIYIHKDRGLTYELIERCKKAKFTALCLTIDTVVAGNRERDLRTGMTMPPKFTLASLFSFAMRPQWVYHYLTNDKFQLANVVDSIKQGTVQPSSVMDYINSQINSKLSWKDAENVISHWEGPFAIKGIMSVDDAKKAVDVGASAIMISNHGGRQLDSSPAPFDILSDIVDAVGGQIEIICDGGVRRGTHVLKALSLGANACSVGRPYLYGLAAGGQRGTEAVLQIFDNELRRGMMLMGYNNINQLDRKNIFKR